MMLYELDDIEKGVLSGSGPHEMLFAPCFEGEHSDCIGFSNGLRRDAQMTICNCECHETNGGPIGDPHE